MTIQEYSNKINSLRAEEIPRFCDDTDLENAVLKVLQHTNIPYFTIETLFEQSAESISLNSDIVQLFADRLSLLFSSKKETGNVCFANSGELRPEFRQNFKATELLDYVYAFAHSSFYKEFQKIAIPSEADSFWKLAEIGSRLSKNNT